jgi:hypothetical protein
MRGIPLTAGGWQTGNGRELLDDRSEKLDVRCG